MFKSHKNKAKTCFTENIVMLVNIKAYQLQPLASSRTYFSGEAGLPMCISIWDYESIKHWPVKFIKNKLYMDKWDKCYKNI